MASAARAEAMGLCFRSAGESHGKGCLALLEGLPRGCPYDADFVGRQLARRQRGYGRGGRQKIEKDKAQVLAGLRAGLLLGSPLALWVGNRDSRLEEAPELSRPRPGHADLAGCYRFEDQDIRANLERASARETAARVAAGAVAQGFLREIGVGVLGRVVGIGSSDAPEEDLPRTLEDLEGWRARVEGSLFGAAAHDPASEQCEVEWKRLVDEARKAGDSLGGRIEVVAVGVPPGIGGFAQWDERLDARLAAALMSIPAVKGVEVGLGFEASRRPGSEVHDPILPGNAQSMGVPLRGSNRAGGLEAGVANGEPIVLRLAKKPIATLKRGLPSVELKTGEAAPSAFERSDVCAVPAASVIAEAMVALVLADACLSFFGGTSLRVIQERVERHRARLVELFESPQGGGRSPQESP